jgi:hypothetical protein
MKVGRFLVLIGLGILVLAGCTTTGEQQMMAKDKSMMAQEKSLYERLGGKEAITAVVKERCAYPL